MPKQTAEYHMTQAATIKGVSREAIRRAIVRGDLKARKVGCYWIINARDLDAYTPNPNNVESGRKRAAKAAASRAA